MDSFCPNCKGTDLVTDLIGSKVEIICSACGTVVENISTSVGGSESNVNLLTSAKQTTMKETAAAHDTVANNDGERKGCLGAAGESIKNYCPSCGGSHIAYDVIGDVEQLVCHTCGYFVEEQHLVSSVDYAPISGRSDAVYGWTRAPKPKHARDNLPPPKGKVVGIETAQLICSQLKLSPEVKEQAVALFERVNTTDKGSMRMPNKDCLGVACAYVVARENHAHVTIRTIQKIYPVKSRVLNKCINLIKNVLKKPLLSPNFDSMAHHLLACGKFSSAFMDKVCTLISIAEEGFVAQGRDYTRLIVAIAFIVYVSEDVQARKKQSFESFCKMISAPLPPKSRSLVQVTKTLLVKLADQLPWCKKKVTTSTVWFYINDIVKYSRSVLSRAHSATVNERKSGSPANQSQGQNDSMNGAGGRRLLIPPSMEKSSSRSTLRLESDETLPDKVDRSMLDQKDLGNTEFDDEMPLYLLTPEEVSVKRSVLELD